MSFYAEDVSKKSRLRALLDHFVDDREPWRVAHPLQQVLLLVVCGTIGDPRTASRPTDLLISDGCDWSGVIAKLFAKSMRPTRKAG
jgi:hypothetical protein